MNNPSFYERRLQTHKLVRELLEKRAQVWALHERLLGLQPDTAEQAVSHLVREFCQELIDYISLEHFGIFHHLVNGQEHRGLIIALAEEIFPQMLETTELALDFNDKLESLPAEALRHVLPDELTVLGDALALRVGLEDRLVEGMLA
jgi:regulator of sigma D